MHLWEGWGGADARAHNHHQVAEIAGDQIERGGKDGGRRETMGFLCGSRPVFCRPVGQVSAADYPLPADTGSDTRVPPQPPPTALVPFHRAKQRRCSYSGTSILFFLLLLPVSHCCRLAAYRLTTGTRASVELCLGLKRGRVGGGSSRDG